MASSASTIEAHQPRQGAVPGRRHARPLTKRDLIRHYATIAPVMLPVPRRASDQPPPLPERRRQARLLAQGRAVARSRVDHAMAQRRGRRRARPSSTSSSTRRRARVGGELRRDRGAPVDIDRARSPPTDVGDDRHRSREREHVRRRSRARRGCTGPPSSTSVSRRLRR